MWEGGRVEGREDIWGQVGQDLVMDARGQEMSELAALGLAAMTIY